MPANNLCQLSIAYCQLSIAYCQLSIAYCPLPTGQFIFVRSSASSLPLINFFSACELVSVNAC
jgi:hypothetical protein